MEFPLENTPVSAKDTPIWSLYYLTVCPTPSDPTIVWGTDVPWAGMEAYLKNINAKSDVIISPAHVLIRAVGKCLAEFPEFNRRIVWRRLQSFKHVNIVMPLLGGSSGPEVCLFCDIDKKSLKEIAKEIWGQSRNLAKGTATAQKDERLFRLIPRYLRGLLFRHVIWSNNAIYWRPVMLWGHRMARASTMINYLGHRGAPPMKFFKPSRFPNDAMPVNITLGPAYSPTPGAPAESTLIVRADHRTIDAEKLGTFTGALRRYLMDPTLLETP